MININLMAFSKTLIILVSAIKRCFQKKHFDKMYDPILIANYFIEKSFTNGSGNLTPMKLLKLVYISHGWYIGITEKSLITERVEAWQYGPVIKSLYHAVKPWGKSEIGKLINCHSNEVINPEDITFLDKMWTVYLNFSGVQLSSLTHNEGTPWFDTYDRNSNNTNQNTTIPNDLIKKYYIKKLEENKSKLKEENA